MNTEKYPLDIKEVITLGGAPQHIRLRGTAGEKPVLLFLHGGPGACDRHVILKEHSRLADVCTMVLWDQRGAGKSYGTRQTRRQLSVDRLVEDARELVEYLCTRFKQDKVFIVGHSWGSLLGTLLAYRYPQRIAAYVGMGQYANLPEHETQSYRLVWQEAQKRGDRKALRLLTRIGEPENGQYRTLGDIMAQRRVRSIYAGGDMHRPGYMLKSIVLPLLQSPEYTLTDMLRYTKGAFNSVSRLWRGIAVINFEETVPRLRVPVYIIQGRHDYLAPPFLAQKWFDALDTPHKEWIWFENSAHSPVHEEPERWESLIREKLFPSV